MNQTEELYVHGTTHYTSKTCEASYASFDEFRRRVRYIMKQYDLSDDRIVLVKRKEGRHYVIVKQKDSDVKTVEFTPNR